MTAGPYSPDHGTVPSEVTVTRDGDEVLVCGVRLSEEQARDMTRRINGVLVQIRVEREQAERQARREQRRREFAEGAVAVVELVDGTPMRLLPSGDVQADGWVWAGDMRTAFVSLLAACPEPRRLWWLGSRGMMHLDGCSCNIEKCLSTAHLLPVGEVPNKVCKRSARKLAGEVTGG